MSALRVFFDDHGPEILVGVVLALVALAVLRVASMFWSVRRNRRFDRIDARRQG